MNESSLLQIVLAAAGLIGTAVIALLNVKQTQSDKAASEVLKGMGKQMDSLHEEVRAVRSDFRVMDNDVRRHGETVARHGESIAGTGRILEAMAERQRKLEQDTEKIWKEGCAHRLWCKDPQPK